MNIQEMVIAGKLFGGGGGGGTSGALPMNTTCGGVTPVPVVVGGACSFEFTGGTGFGSAA